MAVRTDSIDLCSERSTRPRIGGSRPALFTPYNGALPDKRLLLTNRRISHAHKYVYVHVPKTGGTSISAALDALPPGPNVEPRREITFKHAKHAGAAEIRRGLGDDMWNNYFTFAFVRNPWELMVSSYEWWLQNAKEHAVRRTQASRVERMDDFAEYIRYVCGPKRNSIWGNYVFDLTSEDGAVIVDHVGRFESMAKDWDIICSKIGVVGPSLERLKATDRHPYQAYYTAETRELVAHKYVETISTFGYQFNAN